MSHPTTSLPSDDTNAAAGIASVMGGMMLFVVQDGLMKALLGEISLWLLIVMRGAMALIVLAPVIALLGHPHRLLSPLWPIHLVRALLFTLGFTLFYAAFPLMSLAQVTTIFFAAPLFVAILAAFWLGETVGPHRVAALTVGFVGVLIAMNPFAGDFHWAAILPLICAVCYAVGQILARRIGDRESTLTTGMYTVAISGVMILPMGWGLNRVVDFGPQFAHLRWDISAASGLWGQLVLLGLVGLGGYVLLSRAYQIARASLIAPFDYCYLPIAALMAWVVWDEVPRANTLAGMGLIIAGGLYLGYRELQQARRAHEPAPVGEAVFAPGNPQAPLTLPADVPDERG